ncbi:SDR family NAD(P)-dependent oxidoreductase [Myxococcota bacterium]|nr:SDR family NAD(P)-dependent oxidoreductase [Myxococcota bacterium]
MRWALVTAGARGLGEAFVRHLAARGYGVIAHYRGSAARAEQIAADVVAAGGRIELVQADLAHRDGRVAMVAEVARRLPDGKLDLLVNNLGVYPLEHLLDTTIDGWEETFALTCTAVFHVTQLALPLLRAAAPGAAIINLGDSGADRVEAHDDATPYHIAKLGVHVLTRTYAQQLMAEGITVNMISPGFLVNSVGEPSPPLPSGRKGAFTDILQALDYLLAARYVSGANLVVAGAWNV